MRSPTRAVTSVALALALLPACGGAEPAPKAPAPADASTDAAALPEPSPGPGSVASEEASSFREEAARGNLFGSPAPPPPPPPPAAAPAPQAPAKPPAPDAPRAAAESAAARAPLLIYTAQITMAVFEVNTSLARVEAIGRELGGFLARRDDRSITIRVPAERFDEAVRRVEGVGDMLHRNVQAEDVTEEFRDLEVRLRSARAVQQRLTELLAKATKVEDSLAIERELDRVSGEIERIEGRIKFLRDRAAFSTITVSFEAKPQEQVGGKEVHLPVHWLDELGLRRLLSL